MPINPSLSLTSLLRMQSPANVSGAPSRRALDVMSGADEFAPDPNSPELMAQQEQLAQTTGMGFSREALRQQALDSIRQKLGIQQIAHQQELEKGAQKGQFDVAAQREAARAAADRLTYTQNEQSARSASTQQAGMDRLQAQIDAANKRQEDSQAFKAAQPTSATQVPAPMAKSLQDARVGYEGFHPMDAVTRMFGGTPASQTRYEQSLTDVLSRQGTLGRAQATLQSEPPEDAAKTSEQIAAEASQHGLQLSPYEISYLKLKRGK